MENLKIGSEGADVKTLQLLLKNRGYNLTPDGDFGKITETTVKDFQVKHGLIPDGMATEQLFILLGGQTPATVQGIDISAYQPKVDWVSVKNSGIKFVYVKSSEGLHTIDLLCKYHAEGAKSVGLKIGYYHFGLASQDAVGEAKFADSVLKDMPQADLPFTIDIETNNSGISQQEMQTWISTFLTEMEKLGHIKVMIYSGLAFLNESLPANHTLGNIPLWIAEYNSASSPSLPHGWTKYEIWQYSGKGQVEGIGTCDLDKAAVDFVS